MNEIGLIFKTKRQELGLTIEDVNRQIYVPVSYIKAVEEGDMSKFPAEVYYTGTVRRYGLLLGLNTDELISQYANSKLKAQAVAKEIENDKKEFPFIYLIAALALIAGVCVLFFGGSKKPDTEPSVKPTAVVAASTATTQQVVLRQGAAYAAKEGIANMQFARARVEALPFEDQFFDAVICCGSLHLFTDTAVALGEMARVMKPGGILSVFTFTAGDAGILKYRRGCEWSRKHGMHVFELPEMERYLAGAKFEDFRPEVFGSVLTFSARRQSV